MRMLIDFRLPLEPFNTMVKNGTAGAAIEKAMNTNKPEAVYYGTRNGKRGGVLVVDVADASRIPVIAEPLFLLFDATVDFYPVMLPDDLVKANLGEIGKQYA